MKKIIKRTANERFCKQLYNKLKEEHLTGELSFHNNSVLLTISDYQIDIAQDYIGVNKKTGSFYFPIFHCHPDDNEIFDVVLTIGKKGNVTVICDGWFSQSVLYTGREEDCPYKRKWLFGKYHYIHAK